MSQFYQYVRSFYGKDGLYPMGATMRDIEAATDIYIDAVGINFEGDSHDREMVRDILIKDFGYKWYGPVNEEATPNKVRSKRSMADDKPYEGKDKLYNGLDKHLIKHEHIDIAPSLKNWSDYLNENYVWCNGIGANPDEAIVPRLIELILRAHNLIQKKEQD